MASFFFSPLSWLTRSQGSFLQTNELPFYLYDMLPATIVLAIGLKWHAEDLRNYEERGMIELQEYNEEGKR